MLLRISSGLLLWPAALSYSHCSNVFFFTLANRGYTLKLSVIEAFLLAPKNQRFSVFHIPFSTKIYNKKSTFSLTEIAYFRESFGALQVLNSLFWIIAEFEGWVGGAESKVPRRWMIEAGFKVIFIARNLLEPCSSILSDTSEVSWNHQFQCLILETLLDQVLFFLIGEDVKVGCFGKNFTIKL